MNTVPVTQYAHVFSKDAPLILESGQTLGPVKVAYQTYGKLNDDKTNAVLICHALSGDQHAAFTDPETGKQGWWSQYIGSGKPIDTDQYFVICSNTLGSCKGTTGPADINPETNQPYGQTFPVITIGDIVQVQKALIETLKITKLNAVIGGSMGGMQALQWAISYPNALENCVSIAAAHQLTPQALAFNSVGQNAIVTDPNYCEGQYYENEQKPYIGLGIARMIGHITYLSHAAMETKFGRRLKEKESYSYELTPDFQVESYLHYQKDKFISRFDANAYLYLAKAISYFDLEQRYGSLEAALTPIDCRLFIASINSDWLYPAWQCKKLVKSLMKLNKEVSYCDIDSPFGHDSFLMPSEALENSMTSFLRGATHG